MKYVVIEVEKFYGLQALRIGVHQLLHLVWLVRGFGPLWAWSGFSFESFNGFITRSTPNIM